MKLTRSPERNPPAAPRLPAGSRSIPLSRLSLRGREHAYIRDVIESGSIAGNGSYTKRAEVFIADLLGSPRVFLTHSCTAALEICALLTVKPGDEVILPSFTFAATGSAFARCGATLVFVDVDAETLNIDPRAVAAAVTPRTRAVVAMHYGGVGCDMPALRSIADGAAAVLIEDAAHGFGAKYCDRPLGTFGAVAALSFNETKNVVSGEGGALVVNDGALIERAQIIRDRGTNREQFMRRQVDEYSWVDLGSCYAPSDIIAAFLLAQIEEVELITAERLRLWRRYHAAFEALERAGCIRRPGVPADAAHNGHIYHVLVADPLRRTEILAKLNQRGIGATFHYVPLHTTAAGSRFGRTCGSLSVTDDIAGRLIRLPLYFSMSEQDQDEVIDVVSRTVDA